MKHHAKQDIARVAASLRRHELDQADLTLASELVHQGAGAELFRALIDQARDAGDGESTPAARLMDCLERVMPESPAVASYLMGRLYGFAGNTFDHAVYNGIELWMHSLAASDAADALLLLSNEPVRPALKRQCSSWATLIRSRSLGTP